MMSNRLVFLPPVRTPEGPGSAEGEPGPVGGRSGSSEPGASSSATGGDSEPAVSMAGMV